MKKQYVVLIILLSCGLSLEGVATQPGWWDWISSWVSRASANIPAEYRPSAKTVALGTATGLAALGGTYWLYKRLGYTTEASSEIKGKEAKSEVITAKPFENIPFSWAVAETQGRRRAMEDAHTLVYQHPYLIAGIYDGHGGKAIANLLAKGSDKFHIQPLHQVILNQLKSNNALPVEQVLKNSFVNMDNALYTTFFNEKGESRYEWQKPNGDIDTEIYETIRSGSTAVVALINVVTKKSYFAWAGDARALLINQQGDVVSYTDDHKPDDEKETQRIEKAGGFVARFGSVARVNRQLAVARSFGDFSFGGYSNGQSKKIITAEPDVKQFDLSPQNTYKLFISCDGVFEPIPKQQFNPVLSNEAVADIITQKRQWTIPVEPLHSEGNNNGMEDAVKQVITQAYNGGSQDNITAMIVDLGSLGQSK